MTIRTLFIGSVVGVGFLFSLAIVVLMRTDAPPPEQTVPVAIEPTFPIGQPIPTDVVASPLLTVPLLVGEKEVPNFLDDPDVQSDMVNPGFYYLDSTNTAAAYTIQYIAQTGHFTITLSALPLSRARAEAEAYLMGRLDLLPADLCQLRHTVAVPAYVSPEYTSQDLGFSVCAGSVVLP